MANQKTDTLDDYRYYKGMDWLYIWKDGEDSIANQTTRARCDPCFIDWKICASVLNI